MTREGCARLWLWGVGGGALVARFPRVPCRELRGRPDLDDTIRRLQAFEKAGADVLMAPGLPDLESVRKVCASLTRPFNFMAGIKGKSFSVAALQSAGVRRISLATSLWRAAMSGLIDAAREVKEKGTFGYVERALATGEIVKLMEK